MNLIKIGRIINSHSLKGEVRVISNSDFKIQRFKKGEKLSVLINDQYLTLTVFSHRPHKQYDLLKFENYNTINDILFLKGQDLYGDNKNLILGEDEWHISDLIGYKIINNQTGAVIGIVTDYYHNSIHGVFIIQTNDNKIRTIPDVKQFVKAINRDNKTIKIELIDNLV